MVPDDVERTDAVRTMMGMVVGVAAAAVVL